LLNDIDSLDSDDSNDKDAYSCVCKVSAVIQANPQLALNIRWLKQSIKRKIDLVSKRMLSGKIPVSQSGIAIMAPDPIAFFNRLRITKDCRYSFTEGHYVAPTYTMVGELQAHEFYRGGYQGELLAFRNPLTHAAQIRKLRCVSQESASYWYRHLEQVVLFNAHDATPLGMGGACLNK
jgi:hypothetical protein